MKVRGIFLAMAMLFFASATVFAASAGDVLWGPTTASGSTNPVRVVITSDGVAAVAGTHTGSFTMVLYNATSGAATTVGSLPDGILKGLATDGTNIFLGGTVANSTGNNTGIITLYNSSGDKDADFPKTVDYGDGSYADGGVVDVAASGGVGVITGTTYNGTNLLMKTVAYNTSGTQKISKTEGMEGDNCTAKAVDASGTYVAVVGDLTNSTNQDVIVVLYDYNNNKKWSKTYDSGRAESAVDVAIDSSSNIYVLAETTSTRGDTDTLLIKYDYQGNQKWVKTLDMNSMTKDDHPVQVEVDSSGNAYVLGYYANNNDDYFLVRFDSSNGNIAWYLAEGEENYRDIATAMFIDSLDNIIITGYSSDGTDYNYRTLCFDTTGDAKWRAITSASSNEYATSVAASADGGEVVVTGYAEGNLYTIAYQGCGERYTNELPSGDNRVIAIETPKANPDPSHKVYIGVGEVATTKGSTMKVDLHFPQYTDSSGNPISVNIYVAIQIPYTDKCGNWHNDLYFLDSNGKFELMTTENTIAPWRKNVNDEVEETVIPTFSLKDPLMGEKIYPDTTYWFYTMVVPSTVKDDLTDLDPNGNWECTYFSLKLY